MLLAVALAHPIEKKKVTRNGYPLTLQRPNGPNDGWPMETMSPQQLPTKNAARAPYNA